MTEFDDYLNLRDADLEGVRLVVFNGVSGSGKSTAIGWLLAHHPAYAGRPVTHVAGRRGQWTLPAQHNGLVVVDDIVHARELPRLAQLLARGNTVLAAAHPHRAWFQPLRLRWRLRLFRTDTSREKLMRHLDARAIPYTREAIDSFCDEYAASYFDMNLILGRYPDRSFDQALARFRRHCRMQPTRSV
ncbi:MAG: hypothetical protein H8E27_12325 [Verrucomicrobia subdivision 3 bacterium]|nr:hypothetical protein [Limisphaerales bacterium]